MEHGGHQGEGGVPNEHALVTQSSRRVLTDLFEGPSPFQIKRERNVLFVDFHFLPVRYRQVLKARRHED